MFRRSGRVSCKLNNERTKAPDGSTWKCATKLGGAGLSQLPAKLSIKSFEAMTNSSVTRLAQRRRCVDTIYREFDPGSGRTLAACLTHASRTRIYGSRIRPSEVEDSGGRVSNAWGTCLSEGDNSWKRLLIPHDTLGSHGLDVKDLSLKDGLASD